MTNVLEEISDLPGVLFNFLWKMEKEADLRVRKRDGEFRTGLISYAWYVEELQKRKGIGTKKSTGSTPWEKSWQSRLLELFCESAVIAEKEAYYPNGQQVDLKLTLPDHSTVFLEIKGAWRYKTYEQPKSNPNYSKHLICDPKESAVVDLVKLAAADSDYVAFLLVACDIPGSRLEIPNQSVDFTIHVYVAGISEDKNLPECNVVSVA